MPAEGSPLHEGFKAAGLIEVLPDFAIAMDAFLFGARRAIQIHLPTCSHVSRDEATLVALCGLAQSDHERPLMASLDVLMVPTASRVAGARRKAFAIALAQAGLRLCAGAGRAGREVELMREPDRLADLKQAMELLADAVEQLPESCRDLAGNALLNIAAEAVAHDVGCAEAGRIFSRLGDPLAREDTGRR